MRRGSETGHGKQRRGAPVSNYEKGVRELFLAARAGCLSKVKELAGEPYNIRVNEQNLYGGTALLIAAESGHKEVVVWLLEEGGASLAETNTYGATALLHAANGGHKDIVKWLLRKGASV